MNWEAVTAWSTAFTGVVILVTALVGVNQLAQLRAQRRDAAAVELMRSLQDPDFSRAFARVISLPAEISPNELREFGREYVEAAQILAGRFELLGVLVYRGAVSFEVTEELAGGAVVAGWLRLKSMALETREAQKLSNVPGVVSVACRAVRKARPPRPNSRPHASPRLGPRAADDTIAASPR
jgi:hypothetical protein